MLHLNERKAGQSTPCRRPRSRPSSAWWRHCRFAFCLICINVKVITMQAGPARNVFIVLSHASMHSTAAFSPKKDNSRTRTAGAELWAVSCECDNAHSFAHSLLTRPSSTTRRQSDRPTGQQGESKAGTSSIVLMYAGVLIAARLHFVWRQAENLDSRSKPSSYPRPYSRPSPLLAHSQASCNCCSSCLRLCMNFCEYLATNEKQRFNNFALEILSERISCQAISGHICVTSATTVNGWWGVLYLGLV